MSTSFFLFLGLFFCAGGALCAYLCAPHQKLLAQALGKPIGLGTALVLAVMGLVCVQLSVSAVTAVFMLLLVFMTVWSLVPLFAALILRR